MKNNIQKILTIFLIIMLSITTVSAEEINTSIIEAGDTIIHTGKYDSLRLVLGSDITNDATVDGPLLIAGNSIRAEGQTEYGLYAGNTITINENVEKDIFIAGNSIIVESKANIGRDAYIVGNSVIIKSDIPRNIRIGANTVDLRGITINNNAYIMADTIILDKNTKIIGKLVYKENTNLTGLNLATIGSTKVLRTNKEIIRYSSKEKAMNVFVSYIAAVVTMLVIFYLIPKLSEKLKATKLSIDNIIKIAFTGLIVLIIIPIAALIALVTGILLPLSLITLALYVISLYLSTLLTSYIIGNLIVTKLLKNESKYLAIVIGILVIKLIKLIPYVGPFIVTIALLYGLGLIYQLVKSKK